MRYTLQQDKEMRWSGVESRYGAESTFSQDYFDCLQSWSFTFLDFTPDYLLLSGKVLFLNISSRCEYDTISTAKLYR